MRLLGRNFILSSFDSGQLAYNVHVMASRSRTTMCATCLLGHALASFATSIGVSIL